jgi:hypothetical protein
VTKFMARIVMNLVTPKAAAKLELLYNKPASQAYTLDGAGSSHTPKY